MTKEQLIKEFREKFAVAYLIGDEAVVKDHLDRVESFLLSTFDAGEKNGIVIGRASGIEEVVMVIKDGIGYGKFGFSRTDKGKHYGKVAINVDDLFAALTPSSSKDN